MTQRTRDTMSERNPSAPSPIPRAALAGMEDWAAHVAWSLVPERVTWCLQSPSGGIRYLKVSPRGRDPSLADERDRMRWAATRLPVPDVLRYGADDRHEWLLTAGVDGTSAVDRTLRADPPRLVPLLADGLRRFHSVPWRDCPFDGCLDRVLPFIRERLASGLDDPERVIRRHRGRTARTALDFLERHRPEPEELVVCHGDYCVPNVLVRDWCVAGFVDLGALAIADRWRDLAVALWSVTYNLGPGWEDPFLEAYGVARDTRKIAYYRLLYDLLP